jgi:hypothetical protein
MVQDLVNALLGQHDQLHYGHIYPLPEPIMLFFGMDTSLSILPRASEPGGLRDA